MILFYSLLINNRSTIWALSIDDTPEMDQEKDLVMAYIVNAGELSFV